MTAIALAAAPGSARAAPLSENFESGATGWATTGLWHVQSQPQTVAVSPAIAGVLTKVAPGSSLPGAFDGSSAAWFGDPATGTYCVGYSTVEQHPSDGCRSTTVVQGTVTSPPFALVHAPARLDFHAWWEIAGGDFELADLMTVEYSTDRGSTWTAAARLNPSGPPVGSLIHPYTTGGLREPAVWRAYSVDLSAALGRTDVRVRFNFDSVDNLGQGFRGLLIDGISVLGSEALTSQAGAEPGAAPLPGQGGQPAGAPDGVVPGSTGTVLLEPVSGRSAYRTPGQSRATRLLGPTIVPLRTVVDARFGTVRITLGGASGTFHDSVFQLRAGMGDAIIELALLGGTFPHCENACTSAVRQRRTLRRLWGDATGKFRIRGKYAAATVRGTNWLVDDRLGDTLVKVRRGSALVRDFVLDRDVVVNEGESYDAQVVYTNRRRGNPRFGQQYTITVRDGKVVHRYLRERVVVGR